MSAEPVPGGSGAVLLDPEGTVARGLNETGARVWALINGERSVAAICLTLAAEFEVEPAQAEAEVLALLAALSARGLATAR